jgi:hypothetical protein
MGVTATARVPSRRLTHPLSKQQVHSAARGLRRDPGDAGQFRGGPRRRAPIGACGIVPDIVIECAEPTTPFWMAPEMQPSGRDVYEFDCEDWFFRVVASVSDDGKLVDSSFYQFACTSEHWPAPAFVCNVQIVESDTAIPADADAPPCCGTLTLHYEPDPRAGHPDARRGHVGAVLRMRPDGFAKLQACLAQPDLRLTIGIVAAAPLNDRDSAGQVRCQQYALDFRAV